jgi:hypothetical protein
MKEGKKKKGKKRKEKKRGKENRKREKKIKEGKRKIGKEEKEKGLEIWEDPRKILEGGENGNFCGVPRFRASA